MSWAILQELGGKQMLIQLKGRVKIGKQLVQLSSDLDYHKVYKVQNGQPEPADIDLSQTEDAGEGNNKEFFDSNTAQSLSQNEVLEIRTSQGGEAVIDHLIQNSSTFNKKSLFAQEKYIHKKKNKHLCLFRVLQATAGNIADALYQAKPQKFLKSEALFNVLTLSNVHFFSKVLVSDTTNGLITGAVLERTGQTVTCIYTDKIKDQALKYFGIKRRGNESLIYKQIDSLEEEYDSLIFTGKEFANFQTLFARLKGSGTFVIYSQDILLCGRGYEWLMKESLAVNVIFEEIWSREYQVLPQRTHPDMKLRNGTSAGYLVSGIKVIN